MRIHDLKLDLPATEGKVTRNVRLPFQKCSTKPVLCARLCALRIEEKNKMVLSLVNLYNEKHKSKAYNLISTITDECAKYIR